MADTITVWPGQDGWDLIHELEEVAEERAESRNQLILDAIALYLGVEEVLREDPAWERASTHERRIMLRESLREYRDDWD
ncbi:MAG: hypothetical protein ABEJ60_04770 [Halodesulfurarchaeum sp.]